MSGFVTDFSACLIDIKVYEDLWLITFSAEAHIRPLLRAPLDQNPSCVADLSLEYFAALRCEFLEKGHHVLILDSQNEMIRWLSTLQPRRRGKMSTSADRILSRYSTRFWMHRTKPTMWLTNGLKQWTFQRNIVRLATSEARYSPRVR